MRDIGKNIRDLRERAKLTQDALAEQLCTTRQTISNYERGKTRPDVDTAIKLIENALKEARQGAFRVRKCRGFEKMRMPSRRSGGSA